MESNEPQDPTPRPTGGPEPTHEDALRRLEQRLDRASEAAERLIAEAAARAVRPPGEAENHGSEVPPAGWQRREGTGPGAQSGGSAGDGTGPHSRAEGEVDLLLHVLSSLRERIPPELQRRLGDALHEVLLALRALIDWYLERSERRGTEPVEVQDIPIM